MKRNYIFNKALNLTHKEVMRRVAIHEAGHATAIYLGNKKKNLPPIFFQIFITPPNGNFQLSRFLSKPNNRYGANIEGGCLIHTLPYSIEQATSCLSPMQIMAYQEAFEADMINILVGPLAEAKYLAIQGGKLVNPGLMQLHDLHYFGGSSDLQSFNEYLECFPADSALKQQKTTELFSAAFKFINEKSNWQAITVLADYIMCADKDNIECNEIIDIMEAVNNL
ncbi:MAG: hypothetical protein ACXWFI_01570 [Methylobacter sp.]